MTGLGPWPGAWALKRKVLHLAVEHREPTQLAASIAMGSPGLTRARLSIVASAIWAFPLLLLEAISECDPDAEEEYR